MFVVCPVTESLEVAEWYDELDDAKEEALDWSVELSGEDVIVYEVIEEDDGAYEFNKLCAICS